MSAPDTAIAIVGLSGRFPGADDVGQFWANARSGLASITRFSEAELEDAFPADVRNAANFVRARAILNDVDKFDAEFFAILPRVAALTDPQHRLMLECAWSALEDAGCDPTRYPGAIGLFAGCSLSTYLITHVLRGAVDPLQFASDYQVGSYDALLGALPDTLATRVAYKLNLRGPAVTVQSACSTSLLAVAQACQSLLLGQSDLALAGGVSITFPQKRGFLHQEGGMVSADGTCRPFDDGASGTVFGDGVGLVALKRLADAIEDGDNIYAVIRGTAVNNDGSDKVGFTAPSMTGQAEVIATALAVAGVEPGSIGYVECHGTATPLGDPIELAGLRQGFGGLASDRPFCAIGSAKANVGHLDAAAGVTGLIRATMALHHREIPPLANFHRLNRHIDVAGSPFYFPTTATPWAAGDTPRRAGVSSFGVGGTNVHAVLEEAPEIARSRTSTAGRVVLPVSARNDAALREAREALASRLESRPDIVLEDAAFTLQNGRRAFGRRIAVACESREQAIQALRNPQAMPHAADGAPRLVFLFPGQGAQVAGMARGLYASEPAFAALIDRGIEIAAPIAGPQLREALFDPRFADANATRLSQPALFIFEYALARLWMGWGLQPDAMVGHSVGEVVAACLAGVFSFEDGCRFVATRGQLMQSIAPGAMLAVRLPEGALRGEAGLGLDIAAVNAPSACVVAGPPQDIEALERRLTAKDVPCRRLSASHAFHSRAVDPVLGEIASAIGSLDLHPPGIPFVSSVTGAWITTGEATDPDYWARHGRATVRFADALATAVRDGRPHLLEVGPGRTLSSLAPQIVARTSLAGVTASLPDPETDDLAEATASLWCSGFPLDWEAIGAHGRKVSLPTYPFQRVRCWIDAPSRGTEATASASVAASPSADLPPAPAAAAQTPAPVIAATATPALAVAAAERAPALLAQVLDILRELSGLPDVDAEAEFLAQGFDSLLLGQVARAVEKKFGTKITFRQLLSECPSAAALARHLDAILPKEAPVAAPAVAAVPAPVGEPGNDATTALFRTQIDAMQALFAEQLRALQGKSVAPAVARPPAPLAAAPSTTTPASAPRISLPVNPGARGQALTPRQKGYIEQLTRQINARTPMSKASTQDNRDVLADPRTVSGFRREWKEIVYPVTAARAKGSKIWDIDGNEYVDLVNGFGQTMFGHSPDFVTEAVAAQLQEGFPIGPQSPLAGEVAALVRDLTGSERVTFCNTGSEAVMAAMRVARTVTGRERVVVFNNDYHGQFDEALVKASGGTGPRALPVAPGIPPESIANMVVLPYGEQRSLDWIAANCHELAAVMVEPVQSRHPDLRPVEFLKSLRAITESGGAALVFDEIVTGFRVHPGGMQAVFGIAADLATYGKVVGGGLPIGILAGKARFMDALDGGAWRFGDASVPETAATFFAGTFVRHPLVLAAARSVLHHLKAEGPSLQERLAARMGKLVDSLNRELERRGLATRAEGYSSWFHVGFGAEGPLASLFWPQMRALGVHVQEGYPCFLTTAHGDADIAAIERAFVQSLDALEAGGILRAAGSAGSDAANHGEAEPESAPLTEPQIEILTAAQMGDDASCTFNESVNLSFEGDLDRAALESALNGVIARHDALRGRVGRSDERMHFAPKLALELRLEDRSGEADPDAALAAIVAADASLPFDLWNGPLVRAVLVKLAARRHVLVLTAHHIVCDGWSFNIILPELADFYRAAVSRQPAALPAASSFAQYATGKATPTAGRSADLDYWTSVYRDLPPLLELPTDRPRAPQRSFAGATWTTSVDGAQLAALRKAAAASGATLFSTLFTAFQVVIGRLAGTNDVVIGVPVAAQAADEQPDLVGHCVHMLPFRSPLDWDSPFATAVQTAADRLAEGFDHSNCTYGTLIRALPIQRVGDRLPLTEIQFNLERLSTAMDFGGLDVTVTPNVKAAVTFDLSVNVIESAAGLRIDCDYSAALFDEATIARWMDHFRRALRGIAAAPQTPLGALELLSDEDKRFALDTVNRTEAAYPADRCFHDLFAAHAVATPERVACSDGTLSLTYAELDRQSTALAHALLRESPVRQGRIAIAVDRSCAMLVGLLGILKAGHAYVPLDIRQPIDRLRQIAGSARIDAIVCQDEAMASVAPDAPALRLDRIGTDDAGPTLPPVSPEASAYVLFTSGSTGAPKGVEIGHRSLTNTLVAWSRLCAIEADDVFVASSALTFDASVPELFVPLISGARVVLAQSEAVLTGFELVALAGETNATVMGATPTLWRMLLEAGFSSRPGLKMIAAGEALPVDLADRLLAGGGRLWNLYGPTEATVFASGIELGRAGGDVTIGRPIDNAQLFVLDERDRLAPLGAFGTLFIGGAGLAKGYFDRPDLTASAFRDIALEGRAPQRLYATGDRARLLPNGTFALGGRNDRQVKLRGFRIEIDEIESALRQVDGVRDCAVVLRDDVGPQPALVAYVTPETGDPAALRSDLARRLPDYMVPTRWAMLATLPLTSGGKLDRGALPRPVEAPRPTEPADRRPATALEVAIGAVWAEVLGRSDIGTEEPLFSVGADSLHVFRIAARLQAQGIDIDARELMKGPSIAALARTVEERNSGTAGEAHRKAPSLADFRHGSHRRSVTA
ncbi:amino acid adenylation domain-containing protein [Reyranella sp.]|uniref:hybrid non-ribosomal peptide synthetase/type I polyketide synthase n=1 Tax=Reyranella sp. TaxID=1929291 RepID=UPI003BAA9E85